MGLGVRDLGRERPPGPNLASSNWNMWCQGAPKHPLLGVGISEGILCGLQTKLVGMGSNLGRKWVI